MLRMLQPAQNCALRSGEFSSLETANRKHTRSVAERMPGVSHLLQFFMEEIGIDEIAAASCQTAPWFQAGRILWMPHNTARERLRPSTIPNSPCPWTVYYRPLAPKPSGGHIRPSVAAVPLRLLKPASLSTSAGQVLEAPVRPGPKPSLSRARCARQIWTRGSAK